MNHLKMLDVYFFFTYIRIESKFCYVRNNQYNNLGPVVALGWKLLSAEIFSNNFTIRTRNDI